MNKWPWRINTATVRPPDRSIATKLMGIAALWAILIGCNPHKKPQTNDIPIVWELWVERHPHTWNTANYNNPVWDTASDTSSNIASALSPRHSTDTSKPLSAKETEWYVNEKLAQDSINRSIKFPNPWKYCDDKTAITLIHNWIETWNGLTMGILHNLALGWYPNPWERLDKNMVRELVINGIATGNTDEWEVMRLNKIGTGGEPIQNI